MPACCAARRRLSRLCLAWAILLLSVAVAGPAAALDPHKNFEHYVRQQWSVEQGLPQLSVFAIAQDSDGYMWFGTQGGLARFDGVRMLSYGEAAPANLPGPWIQALLAGTDGRLWIGTYKGLAVHRQGHFANVPVDGGDSALDVQALAQDSDGGLLVAAQDGVYAEQNGRLRRRHALADGAFALLPGPSGLVIGTLGATVRVTAGAPQRMPMPAEAADAAVRHLVRSQGGLWAGTDRGLFQLRDGRWQAPADARLAGTAPINALYPDGDGNLWLGQGDQLLRIVDGRLAERAEGGDHGLGVRAVFEDRERNLWLGSRWFGTIRLWNGWTRRFGAAQGLPDPLVWTIAPDRDGALWIGAHGGLFRLADGRYQRVLGETELPQSDVYALLAEDDRLWIGTRHGAALYANGRLATPAWLARLDDVQISGILRDRDQRLWFATSGGLYGWDGQAWHHYGTAAGLRDVRVRLLLQARRNGDLLVGTQAGLYALRGEHLVPLDDGNAALAGADITALRELPDGQLLAGTLGEQLWLLDRGRWSVFGAEQGLPVNAPFFLSDDSKGQLWVAGMRGVYRTSLQHLIAAARTPGLQLSGDVVLNERGMRHGGIEGACCNGAGNGRGVVEGTTLWLPSRDGVVALDTADIIDNPVAPLPRVERVRIGGQWRDNDDGPVWALPARARDLDFEFTVPSFQAPGNVDLRYRLRGYDRDWRDVDDTARRRASYTNLPAGDYVFEVTGSNNAGHWAAVAAARPFRIAPHLHETWWVRTLAALLALVLLVVAYRMLLAWHRRQRVVLERLVRERTEALQSANQRLQEASFTDDLTGLRNRRYLSMHVPRDIALYRRMARTSAGEATGMAFVLVDVDHFKAINDSAGHHVGDAVLQQMAQLLQVETRESDYVVRWGGEEFLLVLRAAPRHHGGKIAERLCRAIAAHPFDLGDGRRGQVTCSMGLVEFPLLADPDALLGWEQLLVLADRALYWVKRNGRNGWASYRPMPMATAIDVLAAVHGPAELMDASPALRLEHSEPQAAPPA